MRYTLSIAIVLLIVVAIVAWLSVNPVPAPTIVPTSAYNATGDRMRHRSLILPHIGRRTVQHSSTVLSTPTIAVMPTATASAVGKTGRGDSTSVQSKPDDVESNEEQSPATATPTPFPTMQATPAPTAHPTPTMAPVPTPTSTVEPIPTAAVETHAHYRGSADPNRLS